MKNNINWIFLLSILFFPLNKSYSQIGVNTKTSDPNIILYIDGMKDNATGQASSIENDVVFTSSGNLGIGTNTPKTRVDVRSVADQSGIFAVGSTTQTASEVGGGAIRYNTSTSYLEYSDGEKWHALPLKPPTKTMVLVKKMSSQSVTNNSTTQITNWNAVMDSGNDFNLSAGVFTAPRNGFYVVSFNATIDAGSILDNSKIETIIESNNNEGNIEAFRSVDSFPGDESGTVNAYVGSGCNAIFNLKKGNTIKFKIFHTLGTDGLFKKEKILYIGSGSDGGKFNTISIYEL